MQSYSVAHIIADLPLACEVRLADVQERMGTLENQVKVLTEEKQELAAEKAALAGQAAVLTQVLQMRDEQLSQLQNANSSASAGRLSYHSDRYMN